MDPLSVLKTLWRFKWLALPVLLLTGAACTYMMFFAPRTYQAGVMYALVTPKVPTEEEIRENPALGQLNSDNPYLRSSDTSLLSQVLVAKMSTPELGAELDARGLGTEYTIAQASSFGSGMLLRMTASADSPELAAETASTLGEIFTTVLHDSQAINGADEQFLFSALPVDGPGPAEEVFSSRLRTVIMTGVAGLVVLFGLVSIARSLEIARERRHGLADVAAGGRGGARDLADFSPGADGGLSGGDLDVTRASGAADARPHVLPAEDAGPDVASAVSGRRSRSALGERRGGDQDLYAQN